VFFFCAWLCRASVVNTLPTLKEDGFFLCDERQQEIQAVERSGEGITGIDGGYPEVDTTGVECEVGQSEFIS